MPTLNWIGKEAVVNHHLQVPFHLVKDVSEPSVGDPGSGNLIVQGDNPVAACSWWNTWVSIYLQTRRGNVPSARFRKAGAMENACL